MQYKKLLSSLILGMMLMFALGCSDDDEAVLTPNTSQTMVRVIHASYDAPSVDIRVDGNLAITDLAYGQSSGYAQLNTGTRNITVTPAGSSSPVVINADLDLEGTVNYTVYAVNVLGSIEAIVSRDTPTANQTKALIRFIHASPDAPAVDIKLNGGSGAAVFEGSSFKDISGYVPVDAGSYVFAVTPAGSTDEVVVFEDVPVQNGSIYTVLAKGTLNPNDQYPFVVRVFVDNGAGNAYLDLNPGSSNVMIVHASPDAPGVDLYADDAKANSAPLEFPDNTGYLLVSAGDRNFKVNPSGSMTSVIDATATLAPNRSYSIFAINDVANIEPLVVADDLTTPAAGKAHVRFMHLSPNAPAVDITLTDGTVVFGDYEFKEYTDFTPLDAGTYDLQVRLAGTDTVVLDLNGIALNTGTIYTVFARGFVGGSDAQALNAEIIVNN